MTLYKYEYIYESHKTSIRKNYIHSVIDLSGCRLTHYYEHDIIFRNILYLYNFMFPIITYSFINLKIVACNNNF